jgi:hypothetical protein
VHGRERERCVGMQEGTLNCFQKQRSTLNHWANEWSSAFL